MTGGKHDIGSDLGKVDAHTITPREYEEIPELGDEFFDQANYHDLHQCDLGAPVQFRQVRSDHRVRWVGHEQP